MNIAVAIPAYNRAHLLPRALESVASQVEPGDGVSMLVVDDASREDLRPTLAPFLDRLAARITVVRNDRNLGLVGNWNRCLELAGADIVNLLHSDEALAPGALRTVRECFSRHPRLGIACSGHGMRGTVLPAGPAAAAELAKGVYPCSSVFVSREAVERCGRFDPAFPYSPDEEYYPRVASQCDAWIADAPLALGFAHAEHHMLWTWEQPDFLERYGTVRAKAWGYAGRSGEELRRTVDADLAAACRHIAHTAWRQGDPRLARRYFRLGRERLGISPALSERFLNGASYLPGGSRAAGAILSAWRRLRGATGRWGSD